MAATSLKVASSRRFELPISANGASVVFPVYPNGLVTMGLLMTATITGANFRFYASVDSSNGTDGNWVDLYGVRSNSSNVENTTGVVASASPLAYTWDFAVSNYTFVKITCTAGTFTGGVATFLGRMVEDNTEPMPAVQVAGTATVSGAVTVSGTATVTPATPTKYNLNSAATTNAVSVKASAGVVYGIAVSNQNAAVRVLKLYDKASAPTVGTDIPVLTVPVPASSVLSLNLGTIGLRFATGIAIATTTGIVDSDTTAVAVGDLHINLSYI